LLVALVGIAGTLLLDFGVRFTETGNSFSERVSGLEKDMAVLVEREGEDISNQEELTKLMEEFHRVDGFAEHIRVYYAQPGRGNTPA